MNKTYLKGKRYVQDLSKYETGKIYPAVTGSTKAVSGAFKVVSKGQDAGGTYIMTTPIQPF